MNILYVCDGLALGGAERQTFLLISEIQKYHSVTLVSLEDGSMRDMYTDIGIPVFVFPRIFRYDFASPCLRLLGLCRKYRPAVLHTAWGWMSAYLSHIASGLLRIPHVSGVVRTGMIQSNTHFFSRHATRLGDIAVANSVAGLNAWKVPVQKGRVIHNGFDWTRLTTCELSHSVIPDTIRIIMIASMSEKKDWSSFLSTAVYFSQNYTNIPVSFFGFGDGADRERILELVNSSSCSGIVHLPGRTNDPISECFMSDIGILLSTTGEGISNTIMEYMACGLPVICSDSGGNSELVIHGVTGFLVSPENSPAEIAEHIMWLIDNPGKAKEMGLAGRKRIEEDFSTTNMIKSYLGIYDELACKSNDII